MNTTAAVHNLLTNPDISVELIHLTQVDQGSSECVRRHWGRGSLKSCHYCDFPIVSHLCLSLFSSFKICCHYFSVCTVTGVDVTKEARGFKPRGELCTLNDPYWSSYVGRGGVEGMLAAGLKHGGKLLRDHLSTWIWLSILVFALLTHQSLVMFLIRVYVCMLVWNAWGEKEGSLSLFVALLKQTDQNLESNFNKKTNKKTFADIEIHTLVGELKCGTGETTHMHTQT